MIKYCVFFCKIVCYMFYQENLHCANVRTVPLFQHTAEDIATTFNSINLTLPTSFGLLVNTIN